MKWAGGSIARERATYRDDGHWPPPILDDPWKQVPDADVAAWRARHPEATCSDRTARCLTWLEREFRGRRA